MKVPKRKRTRVNRAAEERRFEEKKQRNALEHEKSKRVTVEKQVAEMMNHRMEE